jgi:F0F1-type ATP synthase epsilon subunit
MADEPAENAESTDDKSVEPTKAGDGLHMHVKVYAPFKVYFDGDAKSISAINDTGPFDILPKHHNFMTLVSGGEIIVRTDEGEEKVTINKGIMHVKADEVVVFLDV